MAKWTDWYQVLQVQHFADKEVIQAAYKKLCFKYHPDYAASDDDGEMIRKLNKAYEVLSNDDHRRKYDRQWHKHNKPSVSPVSSVNPGSPGNSTNPGNSANPGSRANTGSHTKPGNHANTGSRKRKDEPIPQDADGAKKVISHYFTCLSGMLYEDAYALLCDSDKKNVPYEDFLAWQQSVAKLYQLLDFKITESKHAEDFLLEGNVPRTAERVKLVLHEENLSTSEDAHYSMYKFVVRENQQWRIYLGYRDVLSLSKEILQKAS